MLRSKIGVDCFRQFCADRGKTFASLQDLSLWWRRHVSAAHSVVTDRIAALVKQSLLVIHYESGLLVEDDNRSREYAAVLFHRDHYPLMREFCKEDQRFEFLFTDADREKALCERERGVIDKKERRPILVACDVAARYYHYAMLWWPLATMFDLRPEVAEHIMNNYVLLQIFEREIVPQAHVLTFLECFAVRLHETQEKNLLGTTSETAGTTQVATERPLENVANLTSERVD